MPTYILYVSYLRYAHSCVRYTYYHTLLPLCEADRHCHSTTSGSELESVSDQIHHHLTELILIDAHDDVSVQIAMQGQIDTRSASLHR